MMKIITLEYERTPIEQSGVEMIERKGIGHPDTLADIIAESFSNTYSRYTLEKFGVIANHYVDKVTVVGAKANIDYGTGDIIKNIKVYLLGKITDKIGDEAIDYEKMFKTVVEHTFIEIFKNKDIIKYIDYEFNVHDGRGKDHSVSFYTPKNIAALKKANEVLRSNDTVMCSGYAPLSKTERLAIEVENYICSDHFKERFPSTGYDVKVLLVRDDSGVDITICIPFIAKDTPSKKYYQDQLVKIKKDLLKMTKKHTDRKVTLHINTKDEGGRYAYLTVFGSAIDKGDQGVVGRGNRYNGLISINREMNTEAPAGKNPLHHAGKLFNIQANRMSEELSKTFNCDVVINISTKNGDILHHPHRVYIKMNKQGVDKIRVEKIIKRYLTKTNFDLLTQSIINADPIKEHVERTLLFQNK